MKKALYAGTFDPVTLGHRDIVVRAARLFGNLTVAVAADSGKRTVFSLEERVRLAENEFQDIPGVDVRSFRGLLRDFAQKEGYEIFVRGVRNQADFAFEFQMAGVNKMLLPAAETVFLQSSSAYEFVSSSFVREIVLLGGSAEGMVSPAVEEALQAKLRLARAPSLSEQ